jgi:hypothetical protein
MSSEPRRKPQSKKRKRAPGAGRKPGKTIVIDASRPFMQLLRQCETGKAEMDRIDWFLLRLRSGLELRNEVFGRIERLNKPRANRIDRAIRVLLASSATKEESIQAFDDKEALDVSRSLIALHDWRRRNGLNLFDVVFEALGSPSRVPFLQELAHRVAELDNLRNRPFDGRRFYILDCLRRSLPASKQPDLFVKPASAFEWTLTATEVCNYVQEKTGEVISLNDTIRRCDQIGIRLPKGKRSRRSARR